MEQSRVKVDIFWTPGHSDIKGNEYADQMGKGAADEAREKNDLQLIITLGNVKAAARELGKKKWQDMWERSEKGRNLFNFTPDVEYKINHKFETIKGETIITHLRT